MPMTSSDSGKGKRVKHHDDEKRLALLLPWGYLGTVLSLTEVKETERCLSGRMGSLDGGVEVFSAMVFMLWLFFMGKGVKQLF